MHILGGSNAKGEQAMIFDKSDPQFILRIALLLYS